MLSLELLSHFKNCMLTFFCSTIRYDNYLSGDPPPPLGLCPQIREEILWIIPPPIISKPTWKFPHQVNRIANLTMLLTDSHCLRPPWTISIPRKRPPTR